MTSAQVTMVRIYLTESQGLKELLSYLHDESRVRGVTVFRAISGFGRSGVVHSSRLLYGALDLPVAVEFFDEPDKVSEILPQVRNLVEPWHIVTWPAEIPDLDQSSAASEDGA